VLCSQGDVFEFNGAKTNKMPIKRPKKITPLASVPKFVDYFDNISFSSSAFPKTNFVSFHFINSI